MPLYKVTVHTCANFLYLTLQGQEPGIYDYVFITQASCMKRHVFLYRLIAVFALLPLTASCTLALLNGRLSHGYYVSADESFRCKLPGGVLSRQLQISSRSSHIGETVTFKLNPRLLWRVDHLHLGHHKLASIGKLTDRRAQLEAVRSNYFTHYLESNLDTVDIQQELYVEANGTEVLIAQTYVKWGATEEMRQFLFSIDGEYLNVVHYLQNVQINLQAFTSGSLRMYKSCEF